MTGESRKPGSPEPSGWIVEACDQINTAEAVERLRDDAEAVWRHTPTGGREYKTVEVRVPDLWAALSRITELEKALGPFSDFAGELFARNWNRGDLVAVLDNPDDPHRITAGDFFDARRAAARVLTEGVK